ncbi:MAG: hypothetical protein LQ348_007615 [Seirophora lacunosa]|nr:MAG: hypothetical protein LQ348_007615 [Seirophora lacunosa]
MSFLLLSSFLGTTDPTVTGTDKAMTKCGIIIAVVSVTIDIVSLCWLTLKAIAYLRHRRSRGAQYGTDSSSLWKNFNGGFNLKPLWRSEGGAYDKLPTTDHEKKYHHVELPPTNKPYQNQHDTPTKLIFRGDHKNDDERVDNDGSDNSTPLYPAGGQNTFTAVASGNDHNGIPTFNGLPNFRPAHSTIPPGFMGQGEILFPGPPPHFSGPLFLHIPGANNGSMIPFQPSTPFQPSMACHPSIPPPRPFPSKPSGPSTSEKFTISDSSGEFLPVPDPSSPTIHPMLSASEKTHLKRLRADFEYRPDQVMTGLFVRDNRGFGFYPDYTNGEPGVDANGVRLRPVPGKRLTTRQQHESVREHFRKARGGAPLRPLPPLGYTWVANNSKKPTVGPGSMAADESEEWTSDEET